jgi:hypothetical protein
VDTYVQAAVSRRRAIGGENLRDHWPSMAPPPRHQAAEPGAAVMSRLGVAQDEEWARSSCWDTETMCEHVVCQKQRRS